MICELSEIRNLLCSFTRSISDLIEHDGHTYVHTHIIWQEFTWLFALLHSTTVWILYTWTPLCGALMCPQVCLMIHCGSRGLGHQVATGKCMNIRNILHQTSCGWSSNSARSPLVCNGCGYHWPICLTITLNSGHLMDSKSVQLILLV